MQRTQAWRYISKRDLASPLDSLEHSMVCMCKVILGHRNTKRYNLLTQTRMGIPIGWNIARDAEARPSPVNPRGANTEGNGSSDAPNRPDPRSATPQVVGQTHQARRLARRVDEPLDAAQGRLDALSRTGRVHARSEGASTSTSNERRFSPELPVSSNNLGRDETGADHTGFGTSIQDDHSASEDPNIWPATIVALNEAEYTFGGTDPTLRSAWYRGTEDNVLPIIVSWSDLILGQDGSGMTRWFFVSSEEGAN